MVHEEEAEVVADAAGVDTMTKMTSVTTKVYNDDDNNDDDYKYR
jgi:hypothetical protein